jgi:glucose/mannose transport system substrate-binding protein
MFMRIKLLITAALCSAAALGSVSAAEPKAEIIHWWTSGGESAAVKKLADAYTAAGGTWVDTAIAGGEAARSVAINRIVGGNPPIAAQFNTSKQFLDIVEQGMLNNIDEVAVRDGWDKVMPEIVLNLIRIKGHYYAAPVNIHMSSWIWYSKGAFKKAGIAAEPKTVDEFFAALDKLKAAGLIPLAHGGQPWQDVTIFSAMLNNVGGTELYLRVYRDRDTKSIMSDEFKKVLLAYKRMQTYTDKGAAARHWNDATALLITDKAGFQIMGDWAKGEFSAARKVAGVDYGCIAGLGSKTGYIIQGDVFIFPKSRNPEAIKAQRTLAGLMLSPATQVAFSIPKGSIPVRSDIDASKMDICAQQGVAIMKDKSRQIGNGEVYINPDQAGALSDVLTTYWNNNIPIEKVQRDIVAALKN